MPNTLRFLVVVVFIPALSLPAQQSKTADPAAESTADPTAESAEIQAQLDTIRGVEEMGLLKTQLEELAVQNQRLMQKLLAATEKIDLMQKEMNALREGQEQAARRRSALPELRLVAQLRTDSSKRAEISAAGRTYRVVDGLPFRLQLSNDEVLVAVPSFEKDGTIKLEIDDLDTRDLDANHLLSFRPSSPDPAKAKPQATTNRDDD